FIDVPPKARNDTWPELGIEPFESYVRDKIGAILPPERVREAPDVIRQLVRDPVRFRQRARALRSEWVFNVGYSGVVGGESIARVAGQMASAGPGRVGQRETTAARGQPRSGC